MNLNKSSNKSNFQGSVCDLDDLSKTYVGWIPCAARRAATLRDLADGMLGHGNGG